MLKTYSVYVQCPHCGVYDRDPAWCDLCGKPKEAAGRAGERQAADRDRGVVMEPKVEAVSGN